MSDEHVGNYEYDAGLVLVHGVGQHGKGSFLTRAVGPFLGRMRAEKNLRSVRSRSFAAGVDDADSLEALDVTYSNDENSPEKHLLVVEGRWADAYRRASPPDVSAWVFRHEIPMLWQVLRFFARSLPWTAVAVGSLALLAAALIALVRGEGSTPWAAVFMLASVAAAALLGAFNFNWDEVSVRAKVLGLLGSGVFFAGISGATFAVAWIVFRLPFGWPGAFAAVALLLIAGAVFVRCTTAWASSQWSVLGLRLVPLAAFSFQRGVVIILTLVGMVVLPVLTALLRIIAAVPGIGLLGLKGLQKLEETFFVGSNFGDMHAFADSPARFARIASAVEQAIIQAETRVKSGGTVTVVAHSGGAVVSWVLMTEPFASRRLADRKYRMIAVGGALNWAQNGFDEPDLPPINRPFVNPTGPNQTLGAHIYGTWDAVPHGAFYPGSNEPGPIIPDRFNIASRNLGEPSLGEHGEYWNNQEEVVPVIGRAVDDTLPWVNAATGQELAWNLRSNARLGVVSVLTRVRVALMLAPVLALMFLLAAPLAPKSDARQDTGWVGEGTTATDGNINLLYRAADQYGHKVGNCFQVSFHNPDGTRTPLTQDQFYAQCAIPSPGENILWNAFRTATLGNLVFVLVLWLVALGLLGAYRDLFWRVGGRSDASLTHPQFGISTTLRPKPLRFAATWFALSVVPALLWLVPVLAIHAVMEVDRLVYAAGLALSAGVAFAEWTYVRTLVEGARVVEAGKLADHPLRCLYEILGTSVGRARPGGAVDLVARRKRAPA